jgi:hypothetical protein
MVRPVFFKRLHSNSKWFHTNILVIKQRMQVHGSEFRSGITAAKTILRTEGFSAFYISYPTTLTMTVPFTAVQFSTYEFLKDTLNPSGLYSPLTHVTAGGLAGGVAAAVTTPLDVAKTLLQTRGTSKDLEIRHANGMFDALRIIGKRDGPKGFMRGMVPRVVTFMPSNALCWLSYEFFSEFLDSTLAHAVSLLPLLIIACQQKKSCGNTVIHRQVRHWSLLVNPFDPIISPWRLPNPLLLSRYHVQNLLPGYTMTTLTSRVTRARVDIIVSHYVLITIQGSALVLRCGLVIRPLSRAIIFLTSSITQPRKRCPLKYLTPLMLKYP